MGAILITNRVDMKRMKTAYGLEFQLVHEIDSRWNDYEKSVARCHLANYGTIITDTAYGSPIDNEYDLEEVNLVIKEQNMNHKK